MSEYRATGPGAEGDESPEAIQADIAHTRDDMSATIDAIQAKLNPDVIKAQVQDAVQERVDEVRTQVQDTITEHVESVKAQVHDATIGRVETMVSNVSEGMHNVSDGMRGSSNGIFDTIKANPVPTALIGLGLGWLIANRQSGGMNPAPARPYRDDRAYGTTYGDGRYVPNGSHNDGPSVTDRLGDTASSAKDRVSDLADTTGDRVGALKDQAGETVSSLRDQAGETVGTLRDQAGDRVSALTDRAQGTAVQAKSTFQQTLEENPFTIGALAVALGLAAGLALPGTPVEDRAFGETRDNLVGQVQAKAQDTMQKVQQVAQDVQQSATQTVKDSAQRQGLATAQ